MTRSQWRKINQRLDEMMAEIRAYRYGLPGSAAEIHSALEAVKQDCIKIAEQHVLQVLERYDRELKR